GVRDLSVDDAVLAQRPLEREAELLQDARGSRVAGVGLGLDAVQPGLLEPPRQQGAGGLGRVAATPGRLNVAVAQRRAAVVGVPAAEDAPADEAPIVGTLDRQPYPVALVRH